MKKLLYILLTLVLLMPLLGCEIPSDAVYFYYPRETVISGQADGFIAREKREISPKDTDLQTMLTLYLEGPLSQSLRSPFPKGTTVLDLQIQDSQLLLTLSDAFDQLEGLERTVACASIAKTCFQLGSFSQIQITAGDSTLTLLPNTISLTDTVASGNPG